MWETAAHILAYVWELWIKYSVGLNLNTVLLFLVVLWLSHERRKLRELLNFHLDTLRQQILALRQENETSATPEALVAAGPDRWETIRKLWAETRERIELLVEGLDGRVRRKYGRLPRYSYEEVIKTLKNDKAISSKTAEALMQMNQQFLRLRRKPENTQQQSVIDFQEWYDAASRELPNPLEEE